MHKELLYGKLIIIAVCAGVIFLLCAFDSAGYASHAYVRVNGQDIAVYQDGGKRYLFLPSYAEQQNLIINDQIRELQPQVLQSSGLPALFISTRSGNLDAVYADKYYKESGKISAYSENGELLYSGGLHYIKGRGNYTWMTGEWTKKPFSIEIDKNVRLLDQSAGGKFALIANASDDTLARNDLARLLQEELGMPYAGRGTFTDLYINGEYMGLYYLCATPDIGEDRIGLMTYAGDITGGYLIERELPDRLAIRLSREKETNQRETDYVETDMGELLVIHRPQYVTEEEKQYLSDYLNKVEDAIAGNYAYAELIDPDTFAIMYLTEEIIKNYDAGVTSAFYYKVSDRDGGRLYAAPGWDYDFSLNNYLDWMEFNDPAEMSGLTHHVHACFWYEALCKSDDFYDLVKEIYRTNREEIGNVLCGSGPEELRERLADSCRMEYFRWKAMYDGRGTVPGSGAAYGKMTDFAAERLEYLDSVWITE